nr:hypothetical protein [Tanacetum cinerariifolium]GEZ47618.1 hypothetical protein [Tanacetum cinerariifolium]
MQGTELAYQECECKVYNEFDKFTSVKGEPFHEYYMRFGQLINDIHTIGKTMQQVQVNTKFLNAFQPEWRNFFTNVREKCIWQGIALSLRGQGILHDHGVTDVQDTQTTITHNTAFPTDDSDAYDSNCDDISSPKVILMANLLSYVSGVLSEYLQETQNAIVQDTNSYAQQDAMIMSMFEQISKQMSNHVTNWDKVIQKTKTVNESLTTELERYKE